MKCYIGGLKNAKFAETKQKRRRFWNGKLLFSAVTVAHLGYHYRVIARAFRPVAISWYNLQKCCAMGKVVPGDCHVAALLAMTVVGATWCHSYHIASKQQFIFLKSTLGIYIFSQMVYDIANRVGVLA